MSQRWPGGIISKAAPTPSGPYENSTAPGIWTLEQQAYWAKQNLWPIAGNPPPAPLPPSISATPVVFLTTANLAGVSDNTQITSWTNYGSGGTAYNATNSNGTGPLKVTLNGYPVFFFNESNYLSLTLASQIDGNTGSIFSVAFQNSGSPRLVVLGGAASASAGNCFYGYYQVNGTGFLYRNTADDGLTQSGLASVSGLKAFGTVKNGTSSFSYYDNSTSRTSSTAISGTYAFQKIGVRDYAGNVNSQKSQGYIAEILYYNSVLSLSDGATVISYLKSKYGIA